MRDIKFRGICTEEVHTHHEATEIGEWIYGYLISPNTIRTTMSEEHGGISSGIVYVDIEVDPETIGQFTGLKDRKGNDIYEGDIVNTPIRKNQQVYYENTQACFVTKSMIEDFEEPDFEEPDFEEMLWDWAWIEITGNIHQ